MPPVIKAAWIVFAGLILAGLMVWQPWGNSEPQAVTVKDGAKPRAGSVIIGDGVDVDCVRLGDNLTCNWPK